MPEQELRRIFEQYGIVQTCIVNKDKRHAFVKMISRKDAQTAKDGMERSRTPDSQLRVSPANTKTNTPMLANEELYRPDGVLALAHETAVTTLLVSASSQLAS
jgi:hypothetical protein